MKINRTAWMLMLAVMFVPGNALPVLPKARAAAATEP